MQKGLDLFPFQILFRTNSFPKFVLHCFSPSTNTYYRSLLKSLCVSPSVFTLIRDLPLYSRPFCGVWATTIVNSYVLSQPLCSYACVSLNNSLLYINIFFSLALVLVGRSWSPVSKIKTITYQCFSNNLNANMF